MTAGGSRLVAVFVILASLAVAIVVLWLAAFRHPRRSVRVVKPTTVLVAPPQTPLPRDSGPRNNATRKKVAHTTTHGKSQTPSAAIPTMPIQTHRAPVTVRRPKTTVPKHKATPTPQTSTTPAQTPPPSPPPPPTAAVTTPAGTVTVCVKVLGC